MYDSSIFTFEAWPKIPRWEKRGAEMFITEKIDGTNAAIHIGPTVVDGGETEPQYAIAAQSRTRLLDPAQGVENNGFGAWVVQNAEALIRLLGPGIHYGEWYGQKVQRGYGLTEKRFALFDTRRWHNQEYALAAWTAASTQDSKRLVWNQEIPEEDTNELEALGITPVPLLYAGAWDAAIVEDFTSDLRNQGSHLVYGYKNPEGLVITHRQSRVRYKVILEGDGPKSKKQGYRGRDADGNPVWGVQPRDYNRGRAESEEAPLLDNTSRRASYER